MSIPKLEDLKKQEEVGLPGMVPLRKYLEGKEQSFHLSHSQEANESK